MRERAPEPLDVKALMAQAVVELRDARARVRQLEDRAHAPVAVIGIGCRLPGSADSPEDFRELLWTGRDAIERVPEGRWDADAYFHQDPDAAGTISSLFGGFIRDVDRFDAEFFGISPREAESMDPQHRLLLETAWRALEHANIPPSRLRGTDTGVFVGICTYDYAIRHLAGGSDCGTAYFGTGNALSAAAGRLSHLFGFHGPSLSVDTACSSSLVSVHLACQALRSGECTTSLAAGVNLILAPQTSISFSRAHMLASDGRCKAFDAAANGYVRGEGCGVVVLKLLEDAQRDGDPILAVIRGSAVNQDGASSGLTVPNGPAQQGVIRKALANSRLLPADIAYVEAHGTGTPLGDPIEARSLIAVYCGERDRPSPLWVGSVKSNIGHLEGAAGIASLIKAVLAVQHGVIPPSLHFTSPNPKIEWSSRGLRIPTEAIPWPVAAKRVAGISSFGFTGTNAHVIVEAPPAMTVPETRAAGPALLPLSARNPESLLRLMRAYRTVLAGSPCFADVAAAAALGREHFQYRRAVVAATSAEAADALMQLESGSPLAAGRPRGDGDGRLTTGTGVYGALGSVAARYESGGDVDWTTLCDPAVRARAHVPTYPFRGDTHWLAERSEARRLATHPLLGVPVHVTDGPGQRFDGELGRHAPEYLGDHEVFGRVLVPAAALVEMILSAGRMVCGSDRLMLENFIIHRPLSLADGTKRLVRTRLGSGRATIVDAGSRRPDDPVAEAQIRAVTEDSIADDPDAGLRDGGDRPIASLYAGWREHGLSYGPSFQTLSRVARSGTTVHAEIGLREPQREQVGYYFHPALLDGCLQAAAVSYPEPPAGHLYLPVSIRRLTMYRPASSPLRCEASLVHAGAGRVETDLRVRAADSTLIAVVEGLTLLAATDSSVASALARGESHWLPGGTRLQRLVPRWTPRRATGSSAGARASTPEQVEIVDPGDRDIEDLCRPLRALGHTVRVRSWLDHAAPIDHETSRMVVLCPAPADVNEVPALLSTLLRVLQLAVARSRPLRRLLVVTRGAQPVGGAARAPATAAVSGLVRTAQAEYPELSIACIDGDAHDDSGALAEDLFGTDDGDLAYRDGKRYGREFHDVSGPDPGREVRPIRRDRSYLITGGLGGVGLHIAGWLADRGAGTILLLGRRAPREKQARSLDELRRRADVRVYPVDVADVQAVDRFFDRAAAELPPIAGIFHAAGVKRDGIIASQTPGQLLDAWQPKALGAWNLFEHARRLDLDGFVCIASIAGTFGAPGQSSYAAANACLESFVSWARGEGVRAQCLSYGPWEDTGMTRSLTAGERILLEQRGVRFQPASLAIDELEQLWDSGDPHRLVFFGRAPGDRPLTSQAAGYVGPVAARRELSVDAVRQTVASILRMPADRISADVPLIAIGLDSLMALELRNRCREQYGVDIPAVELIRGLTVAQVVERIDLGPTPIDLGPTPIDLGPTPIDLASRTDDLSVPLSHGQRALWYLHQMQPDSPAYNIAFAVRIRSAVDEAALTASLRQLTMRHSQLRGIYRETEAGLRQVIRSEAGPIVTRHDAAGLDDGELQRRVADEYRRPFDLANGPVMRVSLFSRGREDHVLLIAIHHIAADAWSLWRMMEELRALHRASARGASADLPVLQYTYGDKVRDEERFLKSPAAEAAWQHWQRELAGELPLLSLPADKPRPAVQTLNGASVPFSVSLEESARLHEIARQEGTTVYTVLLAAYQTLLHRYSGQDDIIVGCPVAGRNRHESSSTVGYFVNPIVVRARLDPDQSFRQLLRDTRTRVLGGMSCEDLPFPLIAERLGGPRNAGHSPVFQAAFVMQQLSAASGFATLMAPSDPPIQVDWGGLLLEHYFLPQQEGQFDLTLEMVQASGACHGLFKYNTDLWHHGTIGRMAQHFVTLLHSIVEDPGERTGRLAMLPREERETLLEVWNRTGRAYDLERPLHRWIEDQVVRTPGGTAVAIGRRSLSYTDLNAGANRLARALRLRGVAAGDHVAVVAERGLELVGGLLGTLKSGAAYVPIDPSLPRERLRFMIGDLSPKAVLVTAETRDLAMGVDATLLLDLADLWSGFTNEDRFNLPFRGGPDSLAYTIYTSGSTGLPKGAMNTHRGIVNRLLWMQEAFPLTAEDRVLQKTPCSFDVSVWELFWPLMTGARLVLARPDGHRDNAYLADLIRQAGITTVHFVPPMLQAFLDEPGAARCASVRRVICSGQELPSALQRRFFDVLPEAELHNLYGPTEAAVEVTWHRCSPDDLRPFVPIGRPIANTSIYIVDGAGQPVPIGVTGELLIGGVQVARGYLNQPELTSRTFIPDPFGPAGGTMYRTGDLARFLPDGEIEFLGRTDFQVKIRGLRVELGEIEHALASHPQVREAVVMLREDRPGTKQLTAYLVASGVPGSPGTGDQQLEKELRAALGASLPDYMIPDRFVRLHALPLTANGKVDRLALPAPLRAVAQSGPARSEAEHTLAEIWKAVLGLREVGVDDNFFGLGGDSIRITQMIARARPHGFGFSVRDVLANPTIAVLASMSRASSPKPRASSPETASPETQAPSPDIPLMPMPQWFFDGDRAGLDRFNQSIVLRTPVILRADALREALQDLVGRHISLRLRFPVSPDGHRQLIPVDPERAGFRFDRLCPDADGSPAAVMEACRQSFDLAAGPLAAALLIEDPLDPRVLLTAHHLIVDGVSWRVLLVDLESAYRARADRRAPVFSEEAASYVAWARASAGWAGSAEAESDALYWLSESWSPDASRLSIGEGDRFDVLSVPAPAGSEDVPPVPRLGEVRFDIPLASTAIADGTPPESDHGRAGYDVEAALLASLSSALVEGSTTTTLRVDMEGHGRESLDRDADGSAVVGWCTALYPVLLRIEGQSHAERTASVAHQLSEVPAGGRAFGLCRYLSPRKRVRDALARIPGAEILFNYLGRLDAVGSSENLFRLTLPDQMPARPGQETPRYPLEIVAWRSGDRAHISLRFDRLVLGDARVRRLADRWAAQMTEAACRTYPLTSMQKGILFHALLRPDAGLYIQQVVVTLDGSPDLPVLRQAWDEVLGRHAILRTAFRWKGRDAPVQQAAVRPTMPWAIEDWRAVSAEDLDLSLERFLDEDRRLGIDLTTPPLQRVRILLHHGRCTMVWTHHHLLLDGRSLFLVLHEVLEISRATACGRRAALSPAASHGSVAAALDTLDHQPALEYWRGQLADVDTPTSIPFLRHPSDPPRYQPAECVSVLPAGEAEALHALAREAGVSLNVLTQSLLALFLSRLSGSERVVFGATVSSGRPDETAVGLFISTIPIRVDVTVERQLGEWLRQRLRAQADRSWFEQMALVDIQRCSRIAPGQTLFELLFLFENYPVEDALVRSAEGFVVQGVRVVERTHYPLVLSILPGAGIEIRLLHDASRYPPDAARLFLEGYVTLLGDAAHAGPDVRLDRLAPMDEASRRKVLRDWNSTTRAYPRERCVHELFQEQAARRPDAVAVCCGEISRTYGQLDARSRQIAAELRRRGIGAGSRVGLCVERGAEAVAALIGILDAGGAYVPLDPGFPPDRLAYMVEDCGTALIVSELSVEASLRERLAGQTQLLLLEDIREAPIAPDHVMSEDQPRPPGSEGATRTKADDLMYVIYTSGSTGRPKGVMVPHRAVVNLLSSMAHQPGLTADDVLLAVTTLSFDMAVLELFLPLTTGAKIVLADRAADPRQLMRLVDEEHVTVLQATPATWRMLLAAGWTGNRQLRAFCGGETLPRDLSHALLRRCGQLWNLYGPTETTIYSSAHQVRDGGGDDVEGGEPIGRPIANTSVYILDAALQPVPVGAVGELCIGGDGLAHGYHGNPQLTAERFVCDPFAGRSGARMYRSGDRARFRPDGEIEFLGRLDDEIKVRGHRIALGEIESVLGTHPHLGQAAVRFLEDRPGESRLVAYYTVRDAASLTDAELRDHLRRRLPEYMVPARFVRVGRMPLTPNGKIDRRALPAPVPAGHQPEPDREGPRSPIEQEIAAVWSDVLGDEGFPSGESFFNLGGNSLHLVRVQTAVAQRLGVELDIVEFFRHPTIRQLGALIERRRRDPMSGHDAVRNRSAARLGMAADQQRQQHIRRGARARTRPEWPQR